MLSLFEPAAHYCSHAMSAPRPQSESYVGSSEGSWDEESSGSRASARRPRRRSGGADGSLASRLQQALDEVEGACNEACGDALQLELQPSLRLKLRKRTPLATLGVNFLAGPPGSYELVAKRGSAELPLWKARQAARASAWHAPSPELAARCSLSAALLLLLKAVTCGCTGAHLRCLAPPHSRLSLTSRCTAFAAASRYRWARWLWKAFIHTTCVATPVASSGGCVRRGTLGLSMSATSRRCRRRWPG